MKTKNITVIDKYSKQEFFVEVEKNKSIKIDCTFLNAHNPKPTSVKFNVGEKAEYASYNLQYLGFITGISEKVITFETGTTKQPETRRIKIADFCDRNFNFNLQKVEASNLATSYCI